MANWAMIRAGIQSCLVFQRKQKASSTRVSTASTANTPRSMLCRQAPSSVALNRRGLPRNCTAASTEVAAMANAPMRTITPRSMSFLITASKRAGSSGNKMSSRSVFTVEPRGRAIARWGSRTEAGARGRGKPQKRARHPDDAGLPVHTAPKFPGVNHPIEWECMQK